MAIAVPNCSLSCQQNGQGHWTTVSLYKVEQAATFTWPPEPPSIPLCSLPHWWLQTRLANPARNILGTGIHTDEAQPSQRLMLCQSQPWSKRGFVFSLFLGQNQRACWIPRASWVSCLAWVSAPSGQCNACRSRGSLAFTGKHKKQRQVPKCLTQKVAPAPGGSKGVPQDLDWGLGCEMPWTLLNSVSGQQISQHSPQTQSRADNSIEECWKNLGSLCPCNLSCQGRSLALFYLKVANIQYQMLCHCWTPRMERRRAFLPVLIGKMAATGLGLN